MSMLQRLLVGGLRGLALLMVLMGLLWLGQGLGIIMWPSSSFMLAEPKWAVNGAILAAAGLIVIILLRRRGS